MSGDSVRVLIADNHPITRIGLTHIFSGDGGFRAEGESESTEDATRLISEQSWGLVVMEINLPTDAFGFMRELRLRADAPPIMILSTEREEQLALPALRAGAMGYLCKTDSTTEILEAARSVVAGRKYLSREMSSSVAASATSSEPYQTLSDREFQVLRLIAKGGTVGVMAEEMNLSIKTITTFRKRMMDKMGFRNNAEAMRYAFEHRLVK